MNRYHIFQKNNIYLLLILSLSCLKVQAQDMVGELVAADYFSSELAGNKGALEGLKYAVDKNTTYFEPSPQSALDYLNNMPNIPDVISWKPVMAKVAKSNEWGFTTGPLTYQQIGFPKRYGEYLKVWKRDRKGNWKIAIRAQISHADPSTEAGIKFENPSDQKFLVQRSKVRLSQREEIVENTDRLMGTILRADNRVAYKEFLAEDARLLFSGFSPVLGKENIQKFLVSHKIDIKTTPVDVDRSFSGELAYSYGDAKVIKDNKVQNFYYIRIWEVNKDYKWNVLVEMLFEK